MIQAASEGHLDVVQSLLAAGARVEIEQPLKNSGHLNVAHFFAHLEMVLPTCDYFCLAAYWKDLEWLEIFTTQITEPPERDCNMGYALTAILEDHIGKFEDYDGVVQFLLLRKNRNWNTPQEDYEQALVSAT